MATDLVIGDCVYGPMLCTFDTPDIWADQGDWSREKMDAYARVLAAARNALPELLDEIERLFVALQRMTDIANGLCQGCCEGVLPPKDIADSYAYEIESIAREALGK